MVKSGKPQDKMVTKSDRDGLSVRVTPKGKVIFNIVIAGKVKMTG
ncbi:MAG: hypothetical protein AB8W32_13640 [Arsenophonus endosymbiont of Dermacentor nuttalli]